MSERGECSEDGCQRTAVARGRCQTCYQRERRREQREAGAPPVAPAATCARRFDSLAVRDALERRFAEALGRG